jgi:ElaA protein
LVSFQKNTILYYIKIIIKKFPTLFTLRTFPELSNTELYAILRLRQEVFVVEQTCPYLDCDGKDQAAWHLWLSNEAGEYLAYCRILPPRLAYPQYNDVSIGRVVSSEKARGTGAGRALMQEAMRIIPTLFVEKGEKTPTIRISAQSYLLAFYESFGFKSTSKTYLEDDIPHTEMTF